ncbi:MULTISPECIES: hypothetical protein [unclassified Clostridium]|uniref:hypothetical protein n=1 Tax=unclassified Clostridium TaxID=2614128 RepID=UPI001105C70F|nr:MULTISPECIES: hypothetical protein [unclassified Clostridium]
MEKDLKMYIADEFMKLNTVEEQREFIENLRFLMMADDNDDIINFLSEKEDVPQKGMSSILKPNTINIEFCI